MTKTIREQIYDWFETDEPELTISNVYDLTHDESYYLVEVDSKEASDMVRNFGLNFSIDAKHNARTEHGEEIENLVTVTWKFWK